MHLCWLIYFIIKSKSLDDILAKRPGIGLIIDGEIGIVAYKRCFPSEYSGEYAVKRAHL